jgi:hypothetical protein
LGLAGFRRTPTRVARGTTSLSSPSRFGTRSA